MDNPPRKLLTAGCKKIQSAYIVWPGDSHQRIGYDIGSRVVVKGKPGYVIVHTRDFVYVSLEPIFDVDVDVLVLG